MCHSLLQKDDCKVKKKWRKLLPPPLKFLKKPEYVHGIRDSSRKRGRNNIKNLPALHSAGRPHLIYIYFEFMRVTP